MGYNLEAFIIKSSDTEIFKKNFEGTVCIDIGYGLSLIPLSSELYDILVDDIDLDRISDFTYLTEEMEMNLLNKLQNIHLAYVEAQYAGIYGGGQIVIVWKNGERKYVSEYANGTINQVLKEFGVKKEAGKYDEFETVNLGLHRETKDWLKL